jgi:hypothetical protein
MEIQVSVGKRVDHPLCHANTKLRDIFVVQEDAQFKASEVHKVPRGYFR